MKSVVKFLTVVTLVALVGSPLLAAGNKENEKGKKHGHSLAEAVLKKLAAADLTEEQVAKIKELAADADKKVSAHREKAALSKEQMNARKEALQQAKDDGKKGKDLRAAVAAAVDLTADQRAAAKEVQEITAAFQKSVHELLSAEQKQKAGINEGKKKKKDA